MPEVKPKFISFRLVTEYLPPVLNQIYRRGSNGVYLVPQAREWKELFHMASKAKFGKRKPTIGPVRVEVKLFLKRDRDIDSSVKLLLDALEGVAYKNDRQVSELTISKKMNSQEILDVTVTIPFNS